MKKFLATTAMALCLSGGIYIYEAHSQNSSLTSQAIDLNNDEEIHTIVLDGTPEDVKRIVEAGYDVNKNFLCNTLLHTAVKSMAKGQNSMQHPNYAIEKVKILIKAGANTNSNGCGKTMYPLEWATILPLQMIEMENDINKILDERIKTGTEYCDFPGIISKSCRDITPDEHKQIKNSFHQAFQDSRKELTPKFMEMIKFLIKNGADINKKDDIGQTALHRATLIPKGETLEPLKYLIEQGADINAKDNEGNTPLFIAYALGNYDAVKVLINAGADTSIINNKGVTYNRMKAARKRTFDEGDGTVRTELNM